MVDCRLESICEYESAKDLLLLHLEPERRLYGSVRQSPWGFSAAVDWNPYLGCPPCVAIREWLCFLYLVRKHLSLRVRVRARVVVVPSFA